MDIQSIIELIGAAVGGGGLVAFFLIPEKKAGKRLDNAERLIAKYEPILERLEKSNAEKDQQIINLTKRLNEQDLIIAKLETQMRTKDLIAQEDRYLRCENIGCKKRKPPIDKEGLKELATSTQTHHEDSN